MKKFFQNSFRIRKFEEVSETQKRSRELEKIFKWKT
jgi:hypothetical protein